MSDAFLKSLRWAILAICAVIGTSAFIVSDASGSTNPVIIGILAYGVIYIMSIFWTEFRGKLLFYSIVVFVFLSAISPYIPDAMYILFGYPQRLFDLFYTWGGTVLLFGIPIMTLVFHRYD